VVALAVLVPVATAETNFVASGSPAVYDPGENTWIALVRPGAGIDAEPFAPERIYPPAPLTLGKDTRYDVLVMVLASPEASIRSVAIDVRGSEGLQVLEGGELRVPGGQPAFLTPAPGDGRLRPVYRVPVLLRAVHADDLGSSLAPLEVHTTFTADGKNVASVGRTHVAAEVPWAFAQLMAAGLVLPGVALLAFVRRKRNTR
jgi:hypothetical protein